MDHSGNFGNNSGVKRAQNVCTTPSLGLALAAHLNSEDSIFQCDYQTVYMSSECPLKLYKKWTSISITQNVRFPQEKPEKIGNFFLVWLLYAICLWYNVYYRRRILAIVDKILRCTVSEKQVDVKDIELALAIFGNADINSKFIENELGVTLVYRGTEIKVIGSDDAVARALRVIQSLSTLHEHGLPLDEQAVRYCISMVQEGEEEKVSGLTGDFVLINDKGRPIRPKTLGQKAYISAIQSHAITLGVGPAGTGKTYLAVAMAVKAYKAKEISRIVLTRPAVEAGEKLGFLPGDLQNKVDPYLRPLYDALFDMMGAEATTRLLEKQIIEVAPLAYMRGRTLDDAFIILDEAQNTSREQMKMFLTRMGIGSKVVVTGDITQIDLPDKHRSGLVDALITLKQLEDIAHIRFNEKDVVRHRLVQEIIRAYEKADAKHKR